MSSRPKRKAAWKKRLESKRKEDVVSAYIASAPGRTAMGRLMALPIRNRLDYHSISRQAFSVSPLPEPPKCGQCGKDAGSNARFGCDECIASSVMDL